MDSNIDASYLFFMPVIIICGFIIYLFGFKKTVEPPLLSNNDEKSSKDVSSNTKKKSKVAAKQIVSLILIVF
jgi:hypothetical protein